MASKEGAESSVRRGARVRLRDGRLAEWDEDRIVKAVQRAQNAVRDRDPAFARDVAQVVRLSATGRSTEDESACVVEVEELQDLVERALIEMGRASVAKAYILYRDRRARQRSALEVGDAGDGAAGRGGLEVSRPGARTEFDRGRLAASLVDLHDLQLEHAEQVALAVERRLIDSGLRLVSPRLLAALRDNEVVSMGLELRASEPVLLSRDLLRESMESGAGLTVPGALELAPGAPDPATSVGRVLLREGVRGELGRAVGLDEEVVLIEDLGRPGMPLVRCVPADLLRGRGQSRSILEVVPGAAEALAHCGGTLVVEELGAAVHGQLRAMRRPSQGPALRDLLRTLASLALASSRRLDLSRPGGGSGSGEVGQFGAHLLRETAVLVKAGEPCPRLFLTWDELTGALVDDPGLRRSADDLVREGWLSPVWGAESERWAGPGCRRRVGEGGAIALGHVVALNLPRIARRAGPWREEQLYEDLIGVIERAVDQLVVLERETEGSRAGSPLSERRVHAFTPVGLAEALIILGDGFASAESGAMLVGVFEEATRRLADARGISACLTPFGGARAARSFALADGRDRTVRQPRLFTELPRPEEQDGEPYAAGFDLGPAGTLGGDAPGAIEASLLGTLPSGCLAPFAPLEDSPRDPEDEHPALTAWERFDRLRRPGTRGEAARPLPRPPLSDAGPLFRAVFGDPEGTRE